MNLDITRQSLLRTVFYFLVIFVVFQFDFGASLPPDGIVSGRMLLSKILKIPSQIPLLSMALTLLMVFINSFYITSIVSRNMIFLERTFMPALIYLLVSMGYWHANDSYITMFAAFLLIYAIQNVISSFKQQEVHRYFFNASFAIGLATMVYVPMAVFVLLLIAGLVLLDRGWRDWLVTLLGIMFPTFVCSYIYWGMGYDFTFIPLGMWNELMHISDSTIPVNRQINIPQVVSVVMLLITIVLSLYTYAKRRAAMRKRANKAYLMFIWAGLISAAMFVLPCRSTGMMPMLAVPIAVIVPTYFNRRQGFLPNLLYGLLVLSILLFNLMPLLGVDLTIVI